MRIKQHLLPFFVFVAAILCFVLMPPAFSEFRQVNECELARTNASVTGHPIATQCYGLVDEDSDCNPEDAFKACPGMMTEGEALSGEENLWGDLYSANDEEEEEWLRRTQDFIRIYDPIYNPLSPISVEAGTLANGEPYITIGLGSQEVGLDEMDILVTLGGEAAKAAGEEQILGSLYLAGLRVKTEGSSFVTLYKKEDHMGLGVNVDAAIERIALDTLSWGDADGIPGDNTDNAGYVGLKDTTILGVTASGPVELDVQIYDQGVTTGTVGSSTFALVGTKYVHIGLDKLDVGIDSIETTAVIGDKKDFSGDTSVFGTLYLKDLALNVDGRLDLYNETEGDVARLYTDIKISSLTLDTLSWGDPDGVPEVPYLGGVGLKNLALTDLQLKGELSIDTATAEAIGGDIADDGLLFLDPGTVFVSMGLSNMDISMKSMEFDAALGNAKDNLNQVLGSVYLGGLKTVLDGTVKVHTPKDPQGFSTQGIVLDLNLAARDNYEPGKPGFRIEVLSWGDTDGIGGTTTAGYIGLRDLNIYGLNIAGRISIDVATVDSSDPITSKKKLIYLFYDKEHKMGPTFVHIGLGTGDADSIISGPPSLENGQLVVNFDSADFQLAVDNIDTLRFYNKGILGNFYMKNLNIGINGWVDLSAH